MASPYVIALGSWPPGRPKHVHIAELIAHDISRGRLTPGAQLPGSRALAAMLGVHRNTVHAALAELTAQGWIHALPARGTFVRPRLDLPAQKRGTNTTKGSPSGRTPGFALAPDPLRLLPARAPPAGQLILTGGIPDPRLFPGELLARAYRRALRRRGPELLDYGDPRGTAKLRQAVSTLLGEARGLHASAEEVIITRGSQQALWLAAHAILRPGDRIGVERFGYPPAWDAFRTAGAELVPLAVDADGVSPQSLEQALAAGPLRALYLTPHHQYPTTVALTEARRLRILAWAREHRFAVLEDDYAHEFHYEGRPRLPMASSDPHGQVIYVGTLSKILAPGLRLGFAVAPAAVIERMAALRSVVDRQGDQIAEAAVAELIEDDDVARHARRMRNIYRQRRDVLVDALRNTLGDRISFAIPSGGMAMWVRANGVRPEAWVLAAERRNVRFRAGAELRLDQGSVPFVRLGFTRLDEKEIVQAVEGTAAAWAEAQR